MTLPRQLNLPLQLLISYWMFIHGLAGHRAAARPPGTLALAPHIPTAAFQFRLLNSTQHFDFSSRAENSESFGPYFASGFLQIPA